MSYNTFQHYTFDTNLSPEPLLNYQINSDAMLNDLQYQLQSHQIMSPLTPLASISPLNSLHLPWTPCSKFLKLINNFNSNILNQFICTSCAFCGRLMYPEKCEWLSYDPNFLYPLL